MITFKQYISEDYTYMYKDKNISKMSLYDALVLAHEIEYKWSKIKDVKPNLEKDLYNVLLKIYNKFKIKAVIGMKKWFYMHCVPTFIERVYNKGNALMCILTGDALEDYSGAINSHPPYRNTLYLFKKARQYIHRKYGIKTDFMGDNLSPDWADANFQKCVDYHESLDEYLVNQINDDPWLKRLCKDMWINKFKYKDIWESLKPWGVNGSKPVSTNDIVNDIEKIRSLMGNPSKNISSIMTIISLVLNIVHHRGKDFALKWIDLGLDDLPTHSFSKITQEDMLDQLSNLPTYKWDKELEQEFDIGSFKGQIIK